MAEHQVGPAGTFLRDGEMRQIDLGDTAIVLARVGSEYHAFGAKCTHYGAPLSQGVLKDHDLICPWHHACFDIRSGARLEPPALNDLPHYPVRIEKGQIVVTLSQDNQTEPQGKADPSDQRTMVIIGGGSAGNAAAEELRRSSFRGRIIIISQVPELPIDRPNLSKDYMAGKADPSWIPLRSEGWYAERDIDVRVKTRAVKIDPRAHTIYLDPAGVVGYDKLLLATGGTPRSLSGVSGADFDGVFTLRSLGDADRIIAAAEKGKRAVIIGSSFIGMEVAASLAAGRGVHVTVIGRESVPFERSLGPEIGAMLQQEHEANGVQFKLKSEVARLIGEQGHVTGVELKDGKKLEADFVIVGVGVRPATGFLNGSGLKMDEKDQSIRVNAHLQSSDPDIYAAGDIARWDDGTDSAQRIEHWRTAEQQGIIAALNMLGKSDAARTVPDMTHHVPFFWTEQWGVTLRYVGHAAKWDEIIYREGTPAQKAFVALYVAGGKLLAAAGCQRDQALDAIEFILREKMPLTPKQMRDESFDLVTYSRGAYSYK